MNEQEIRSIVQDEIMKAIGGDVAFIFQKNIQIFDARNIQLGRKNGTQIGTSSDQKVGFYGVAPVVQAGSISNPSGSGTAGVDNPARNAINAIITALHNVGIIA